MRRALLGGILFALLITGCSLKTYTFEVVDADTHQPMKGVHIGHRDVLTPPDDEKKVLWFSEVWHPLATADDGRFTCTMDSGWWHVLHFCPPDCEGNGPDDHLGAFATISPTPVTVRIGDWPKEGTLANVDGVIFVELETAAHRSAKLRAGKVSNTT